MADNSTVVCQDCQATVSLPHEPTALAHAVTEFVDAHHRLQHWKIDLLPGSDIVPSSTAAAGLS